jgi:hypothetical protein
MKQAKGRLIGYARVSTDAQATEAQEIELRSAGCDVIVQEHGSGASRARPALAKLIREIGAGEIFVVVRLDRLARSVGHLLAVIGDLTQKGAHFRSLRDPIDTTTPQGMFSLQVLGAVAQLERADLGADQGRHQSSESEGQASRQSWASRTKASSADEDGRRTTGVIWLPTDIARALKQRGLDWTPERLRRAVKWLVRERLADPKLLDRASPQLPEDRLMTLVAGISQSNPDLSLRDIAAQLERLYERTPRGSAKWSASSVKNLLDRARRLGLVTEALIP